VNTRIARCKRKDEVPKLRNGKPDKFSAWLLLFVLASLSISISLGLQQSEKAISNVGTISTSTLLAKSGSAQDIQTAVNTAAATGISNVYIPAGNFNFVEVGVPWTTVNIPAGINVFGDPTTKNASGQVTQWKTNLLMPYDVPGPPDNPATWFTINGNGNPNKHSRFSDIQLIGYRYYNNTSNTVHTALNIANVVDFRIDHCSFQDTTGGIWVGGDGNVPSCGVIDHCRLVNSRVFVSSWVYDCDVGYGVGMARAMAGGTTIWESNIDNVLGKYLNYSIYIEDCYFSKWRHCTSSNDGQHVVFRHNIVADDAAYASCDAHGSYAESTHPNRVGTRAYEIYDNQFLTPNSGMSDSPGVKLAIHIRGGGGVIFNNTVKDHIQFIWLSNDAGNEDFVPQCKTHDLWIWNNNLVNVTYTDPQVQSPDIVQNQDYYLSAKLGYTQYVYPHPLTLVPP